MFTAVMSLGLVVLVVASKAVYSHTMDQMISESEDKSPRD